METKEKEKVSVELKYYRSCSELPYYNFYRILETRNHAYLIKGWDEESDIKFNPEKAKKYWKQIYQKYCDLRDDNKLLMYYEVCSELLYCQTRIEVAVTLIDHLIKIVDKETLKAYADEIRAWEFSININKPIESEVKSLTKQLKRAKNRINILIDQKKDLEPEETEQASLMEQTIALEDASNKQFIDPKVYSTERWVVLVKRTTEKNNLKRSA